MNYLLAKFVLIFALLLAINVSADIDDCILKAKLPDKPNPNLPKPSGMSEANMARLQKGIQQSREKQIKAQQELNKVEGRLAELQRSNNKSDYDKREITRLTDEQRSLKTDIQRQQGIETAHQRALDPGQEEIERLKKIEEMKERDRADLADFKEKTNPNYISPEEKAKLAAKEAAEDKFYAIKKKNDELTFSKENSGILANAKDPRMHKTVAVQSDVLTKALGTNEVQQAKFLGLTENFSTNEKFAKIKILTPGQHEGKIIELSLSDGNIKSWHNFSVDTDSAVQKVIKRDQGLLRARSVGTVDEMMHNRTGTTRDSEAIRHATNKNFGLEPNSKRPVTLHLESTGYDNHRDRVSLVFLRTKSDGTRVYAPVLDNGSGRFLATKTDDLYYLKDSGIHTPSIADDYGNPLRFRIKEVDFGVKEIP